VIAVIPVRGGALPLGADEAVAEAGGHALVVGSGTEQAANELEAATGEITCIELGSYAPAAWSARLAAHLDDPVVVLPASPDGRDLAPRLAFVLDRPLLAPAISVTTERAVLTRQGGLVAEEHRVTEPVVVTLEPGVRGVTPAPVAATLRTLDAEGAGSAVAGAQTLDAQTLDAQTLDAQTLDAQTLDAESLEVLPPDPATMDLAEAPRIVAGGAGLGGPQPFETLKAVAAAIGATWGASRVAADAGWVPQHRFIGTTGVTVGAKLYVALGISGAVQHVTGLGAPDHVIAVNTDASAPMMTMADLAIVTDARALLDELASQLGVVDGGH